MQRFLLLLILCITVSACQTVVTAPASPLKMQQAQINGANLAYVEQGQGVPVVFVHGSMSDYRIWEAQRLAIAGGYRYIAYTQRYFGDAPWPGDGKNFNQMTHAADLIAFIQRLNVGPVHLVAWSYGGSVATLAASQHPELFRSLSLNEPTIGSLIANTSEGKAALSDFGKHVSSLRAIANTGNALAATKQFWEFVMRLPDGGFDREPQSLQQIALANVRSVPLTLNAPPQLITCEMVKAIHAPVLVTIGADTRALWTLAGKTLADCVSHGALVVIPHSNHDAILRNPSAFNEALLDFLARH